MAMQPARQYMTFEQYLLLVNNSDRHYEYYNGEVRLMAGGTSNHATIALNCGVALDQALGDDAVCRPYVTDKLVRVAPTKTPLKINRDDRSLCEVGTLSGKREYPGNHLY